jgi:hypothetical protein
LKIACGSVDFEFFHGKLNHCVCINDGQIRLIQAPFDLPTENENTIAFRVHLPLITSNEFAVCWTVATVELGFDFAFYVLYAATAIKVANCKHPNKRNRFKIL